MTAAPARAMADWTEEVSLIQPRQAAFWLFSGLLLICGSGFVDEQLAFANASTKARPSAPAAPVVRTVFPVNSVMVVP